MKSIFGCLCKNIDRLEEELSSVCKCFCRKRHRENCCRYKEPPCEECKKRQQGHK